MTKLADGRCKGQVCAVTIKSETEILPNVPKIYGSQPDLRVSTQGIEIGAGWTRKGDTSG